MSKAIIIIIVASNRSYVVIKFVYPDGCLKRLVWKEGKLAWTFNKFTYIGFSTMVGIIIDSGVFASVFFINMTSDPP